MTDRDIVKEFWAVQFHNVLEKGKTPTLDYFDTDFVDDALAQWAEEDNELAEVEQLKATPDEWEEITP